MPLSEEYHAAMDRALEYLGPRARSRQQVAHALVRWGYGPDLQDEVLDRLEELAILDDRGYALEAARQGRARGKGAEGLRRELAVQGFSDDDIEAAMAEVFSGAPDDPVLGLAAKKAATLKGLPPETQYRRLASFLARRGHDSDKVGEVCRQILGDFARSD